MTHFTQTQVTYILSRLRSDSEVDGFAFASCNPDAGSWVLNWIEWWLDEDGYPDKKKQGIVRYYLLIEDEPVFADSKEELREKYPDFCRIWNPVDEEYVEAPIKSFTFLAGTIFDNPILIKKNPAYLAELNSLPRVERASLLDGCWYAIPEASGHFKRDWLIKVDSVPLGSKECRAWDKAATYPSEVNRYPDFTASTKMYKCKDGYYYIVGNCGKSNFDPVDTSIKGRFRRRSGDRDKVILDQAKEDGDDCHVIFPLDPAAAGKIEFEESSKKLIEEGFIVKKDPTPSGKSKLVRFTPFTSAAENGLVRIVESSFPDKKTLNYFYKELEVFDGDRSTSAKKDDVVDATASAFNYLARQKVLPSFSLGDNKAPTRLAGVKQSL